MMTLSDNERIRGKYRDRHTVSTVVKMNVSRFFGGHDDESIICKRTLFYPCYNPIYVLKLEK